MDIVWVVRDLANRIEPQHGFFESHEGCYRYITHHINTAETREHDPDRRYEPFAIRRNSPTYGDRAGTNAGYK